MHVRVQDLTVFGQLHCPREAVYVEQRYTLGQVADFIGMPDTTREYLSVLSLRLPPTLREAVAGFSFVVSVFLLRRAVGASGCPVLHLSEGAASEAGAARV